MSWAGQHASAPLNTWPGSKSGRTLFVSSVLMVFKQLTPTLHFWTKTVSVIFPDQLMEHQTRGSNKQMEAGSGPTLNFSSWSSACWASVSHCCSADDTCWEYCSVIFCLQTHTRLKNLRFRQRKHKVYTHSWSKRVQFKLWMEWYNLLADPISHD